MRGACFSPDGRRLLSVSLDSVVCIWDVDAETRSADEVALLIDYASSYRCEGEVIVPITQQTSSGAPALRLLPASAAAARRPSAGAAGDAGVAAGRLRAGSP